MGMHGSYARAWIMGEWVGWQGVKLREPLRLLCQLLLFDSSNLSCHKLD